MRVCPGHKSRVVAWLCATMIACGATFGWAAPSTATDGASEHADPQQLGAIFGRLKTLVGIEARFVEEKHLALLAEPLQNKGTLYFSSKGYLLRRIDAPLSSSVRITPS